MLWPKKKFIQRICFRTKKIHAARKFPSPPPITFLMVRPLVAVSGLQIITARIAIRRRSIQKVYSVCDAGKEIYLVKINPHTKMSSA